jgi:hypothetical protein
MARVPRRRTDRDLPLGRVHPGRDVPALQRGELMDTQIDVTNPEVEVGQVWLRKMRYRYVATVTRVYRLHPNRPKVWVDYKYERPDGTGGEVTIGLIAFLKRYRRQGPTCPTCGRVM